MIEDVWVSRRKGFREDFVAVFSAEPTRQVDDGLIWFFLNKGVGERMSVADAQARGIPIPEPGHCIPLVRETTYRRKEGI